VPLPKPRASRRVRTRHHGITAPGCVAKDEKCGRKALGVRGAPAGSARDVTGHHFRT
jgi:hypothetical protein